MEGGMKVLTVLVWGFFVFLLIAVCLQDLELQLPPQSSAWASSWRIGCGFDQPQPCASIPASIPEHGVQLFGQVAAWLEGDTGPAAVTALPEPSLALRAKRKMLASPIASGVQWVFSFSMSTLLPRPLHKSPHWRKGPK